MNVRIVVTFVWIGGFIFPHLRHNADRAFVLISSSQKIHRVFAEAHSKLIKNNVNLCFGRTTMCCNKISMNIWGNIMRKVNRKAAITQVKVVDCVVLKLAFGRKVSLIRFTDMTQQQWFSHWEISPLLCAAVSASTENSRSDFWIRILIWASSLLSCATHLCERGAGVLWRLRRPSSGTAL